MALKCNGCIHNELCDADRFAYEECNYYHGTCKDCNEYVQSQLDGVWMCCVTSSSMPEWGYCNFWEGKDEV